ncbi:MAG: hypothetical protein JWR69_3331 [Pedosphaera sp.]|nr:hypothetical protein [Pedosphaera sp.]
MHKLAMDLAIGVEFFAQLFRLVHEEGGIFMEVHLSLG